MSYHATTTAGQAALERYRKDELNALRRKLWRAENRCKEIEEALQVAEARIRTLEADRG